MLKRTITGLLLLVVLLGFLLLAGVNQIFFDILIFVCAAMAMYEMFRALQKGGYKPIGIPLIIMSIICYPLGMLLGVMGILIAAISVFFVAFAMFIFNSKYSLKDFMATTLIIIYPYVMVGLAYALNADYGMIPLLLALGASMGADVFAYFIGSALKGPKIFPTISPKKTYAGCIGGIFGGAIGALLIFLVFEVFKFPTNVTFTFASLTGSPIVYYVIFGAIIAFFAEIGDLGASRIKRELGIKDYGKVLGAHGGIMDRLDSMLFAVIFMAIYMFAFVR